MDAQSHRVSQTQIKSSYELPRNNRHIAALSFYLIAISIVGVFGIKSGDSSFLIAQALSFVGLFAYIIYSHVTGRLSSPLSRTINVRFVLTYTLLLTVGAVSVMLPNLGDDKSILSSAQLFLPILLALLLTLGLGGVNFSKNDIHKLISALVVFLVASSLYSFVVDLDSILSISSISNSYEVDIKGFFSNRNVFGYMMAIGVACSIYLWRVSKKSIYIATSIVMMLSLIMSMSRGGILFLAVFFLVFILANTRSKLLKITGLTILLAPLAIFLVSQPFVQDNIIRADNGDTGRTELREFGLTYYTENNLIVGSGERGISIIEDTFRHSSYHNLYIEVLVTQGLVGILATIVLFVFSYSCIRIISKHDKQMAAFLTACLIAYLTYVLLETLPLFYATPNSIVTTYILILIPMFAVSGIVSGKYKEMETR